MINYKMTLHHTGGGRIPNWKDQECYHILVLEDGSIMKNFSFHLPSPFGCWMENSWNIQIAVCAMLNASPSNFEICPITEEQIESMLEVAALIALIKNIPIAWIKTHAERAIEKYYFPEKWDFACLTPDPHITPEKAILVGNQFRKRISLKKGEIGKVGIKNHKFYKEVLKSC